MVNSLMMLAVEANGVVALRMMKLMRGGRSARREAELMVSEKIRAAFEATASLMAGCVYRKLKSGRSDGEARQGSGVNE